MADWLKEQKADAAVLAALDSIAWTFNVRGKDVDHTPVALSFALVRDDGTADLFVASEKIGDDVRQHLGNGVRLHERDEFERALAEPRRQDGRGRSRALGGGDLRGAGQGRRPDRRQARPLDPAQGDQERDRDRRPPRRPGARRRRALALPPLALDRGAEGRRRRAQAAAKLQALPPAGRRPSRPQLRHHLRRRPERRDRPLPGRARRPTGRSRWIRSTWSIRAANIRTAPPT